MESSQSYAATLTHYSTEPLTPGPDYDPLLLLLALAGDVHPNPGPSRYPCSVCFKNVTSQGTSYLCTRCSHWVHSRCSGLRNAADYRKANGWICTACMTPPQSRTPPPPPTPSHMPTISDKTFNILQWNANGIGIKQTELSIFLEAHNVKVAAIQESKLTAKSRSPNIQNYTLVQQDRRLGPGGGLLFFIHNSVSFTRKPLSTMSKNDPHLEELTITIAMDNTELLITNVYIPPASSCNGRYSPPLDHLLTGTDSLVLGDFNAHHSLWHSGTTDTRGNQLADSVSTSSFAVLNTDSPTRLPGSANPSIDHLHQESLTLRVKDHSDMLSAQYLVNCLEKDHVCHGITTQEPRPRPMKETLHSRHHSTVLPRLGSSRMESHQNLHTHAVESAIQLQGNNRVLKKPAPPISDEEQRLNRRQRCTLSQLRSGHCHLLQDYKHRVLGEPSDTCTDCGASPQDVTHLFDCTTHPTDLSPEDLWRNPVGSIRAFSYLDNGNLD